MSKLVDLPNDVHKKKLTHGFFEDFNAFGDLATDSTQRGWLMAADTGCSADNGGAAGGVLSLVTSATDNNAVTAHTDEETFLFAADKPLVFGARVKYTEANTDDANIMVGVSTVCSVDTMLDDGAGPAATYDGVVFYKVDGGTQWNTEVSFAGTQNSLLLSAANSLDGVSHTTGAGDYEVLEFSCLPRSSTTMDVLFYIDGVLVNKETDITMTTPAVMYALASLKAGGANAETLTVDYIYCYQTR